MSNHSSLLPASPRPRSTPFCPISYRYTTETDKGDFLTNIKTYSCNPYNTVSPTETPSAIPGHNKDLRQLSTPPIAFLGRSFTITVLDGERTVLRKGKQRHCWHVADPRQSAMVLAGVDAAVLR